MKDNDNDKKNGGQPQSSPPSKGDYGKEGALFGIGAGAVAGNKTGQSIRNKNNDIDDYSVPASTGLGALLGGLIGFFMGRKISKGSDNDNPNKPK